MKINYNNYNHISYDLWLTLIKSNSEFKSQRNNLFRDFFQIDAAIDKVSNVVRYYDVVCNHINEKTGRNLDTYEIYYLILSKLKVDISELDINKLTEFYKETEILFMKYKPQLIYPEIHATFKKLKSEDKTINILSNTGFIKGKSLRKLMGYYELEHYLKFQIYSDEVGFSKPNIQIFQLVHEQIGTFRKLCKKEVLHVGDNVIADYYGAKAYGFDGFLLKN